MPTLQELADQGIQTYNGQQYSNTSGNTYTPIGGGSSSSGGQQAAGIPLTPTLTLAQAQQQAEQAFSGIVSPMTLEDIRAREREAQGITSRVAESIYNPQISEAQRIGGAKVSTAEGVVGQRQGFNISTAELAFVADTQAKVTAAIKDVQNQKQAYIDQGNMAAANRADDQLQKLNEFNAQMTMAKANYALQLMSGSREQAQLELAQTQAKSEELARARQLDLSEIELLSKIPQGQTFSYNGRVYTGLKSNEAEPLTNAELISLMKEVPYGQTQTFNLGGKEYTVRGTDRSNPGLKVIESTNNAGQVIFTTYDINKGKIINQVSAGNIGKTGGSGTSVSVTMPSYSQTPYYVGGQQAGYIRFDSKSNRNIITDYKQGEIPQLPAGATLGTFQGGNPNPDADDGGWD